MSSSSPTTATLQFQSLSSGVDVEFWHGLNQLKLNEWQLDDGVKMIQASYAPSTIATIRGAVQSTKSLPGRLTLGQYSLSPNNNNNNTTTFPLGHVSVGGELHNFNTLQEFKEVNHNQTLRRVASQIWRDIVSGAAERDPSLLNRFMVLSYADLKQHCYYYWFAFPALVSRSPDPAPSVHTPMQPLAAHRSATYIRHLMAGVAALMNDDKRLPAAFLVVEEDDNKCSVLPLSQWHSVVAAASGKKLVHVAYVDGCELPSHPGWPLRNLLLMASARWNVSDTTLKVISFRDLELTLGWQSRYHDADDATIVNACRSTMMEVYMPSAAAAAAAAAAATDDVDEDGVPVRLATVGWERNTKQKLQPRKTDLKTLMDPRHLAATAVDLNLKLMRWRVLPQLDLPLIAQTKCLLLGAGTLGCNVARTLLGWGVRHITLVDNGKVSFSNPARQSLFVFADCMNGGQDKASCAARHLTEIFPDVTAIGHKLSIAMPGHAVAAGSAEEKRTLAETQELDRLVQEHDVVFLLTDSRESRWLPTLMCCVHDKMCINLALGFDTFVVMRHGRRLHHGHPPPAAAGSPELGCYFCNDVVAPTDSLTRRTLDQQCTVTRPGLSFMASSLGVELMVSLLHHSQRHGAAATRTPATTGAAAAETEVESSPLGDIPHQIRGFLRQYQLMPVVGERFGKCTACSDVIIDAYRQNAAQFVLSVLNGPPSILEDLTGLTALKQATDDAIDDWDISEDDDDDDDEMMT